MIDNHSNMCLVCFSHALIAQLAEQQPFPENFFEFCEKLNFRGPVNQNDLSNINKNNGVLVKTITRLGP